ncbi:peptide ABC transporter substrate-binding protein [Actinoalloteichus sp. AHMU CJ021]|uniref:Peptide/nickel transport system substrate-binding protein n=1 Tax=Actinoalloteichus caeruleus DSM 43889 TaxID=1120930 RepID=A0ABT1JCH0_ACTCY|nr:ABC transporter substrate-binding protein [Actinoalloteichus caeruleus]AUS80499.1 peptide ABC transporter substrate-binding protein [Actinoalloteichus sp. AHMU CJ021]MCP2329851.1 peptide/nickel transport system substrate-binding protein [Actinoalloteichus caeruleus DSM 43889]
MRHGSTSVRPPGGISRRSLLAGGLGALGATWLAAGCSSSGPASRALPVEAATGDPASGGVLRIARPPASDAETLDPASALSAYEYLGAVYNRLTRIGEDGSVVADLAEGWEPSPDGTRWTFALRRGVTFHDGRPFTSADARYTLRHLLDPDVASPQAGVLAPMLEPGGIHTPDPHTLVVDLTRPNAEFPSLLTSYNCYVIPDGSAEAGGRHIGETGVGTGPFRLESFTPAGRGRVVANPEYWEGRPVLDEIEFYAIPDTQARSNALLAGQVHLLSQTNLDFATARVINASDRATIARSVNSQWYGLPMLCTAEPFTDPSVRQAMKLAYDPQAVLDVALQGAGVIGNDNPVPPEEPYWTDYRVERDPEHARFLLRRAGLEGLRLDLHTSAYDPVFTPMALAFRDSVREAGITLDVRTAAAESYFSQIWMQKPLMATYWYTGRPIEQLLNQIFRGGSSYNETAWADDRFDGLLDEARGEMDADRRRMLYQDAQRYVVDHGGSITPVFADRLVGLSRDVLNYREHGFEFDYLNIGLRR